MQMNLREKTIDFSKNSRQVQQKWFWLSSTCWVILVWKLTLASRKSSSKYWRFVLEFICHSLYGFILRESHYDHNSRTSSTRNTNIFDREDKKFKQNEMKIYIDMPNTQNLFFRYFLACPCLMTRRQCSSNKLMALQIWFFFSWYAGSWKLPTFF